MNINYYKKTFFVTWAQGPSGPSGPMGPGRARTRAQVGHGPSGPMGPGPWRVMGKMFFATSTFFCDFINMKKNRSVRTIIFPAVSRP